MCAVPCRGGLLWDTLGLGAGELLCLVIIIELLGGSKGSGYSIVAWPDGDRTSRRLILDLAGGDEVVLRRVEWILVYSQREGRSRHTG